MPIAKKSKTLQKKQFTGELINENAVAEKVLTQIKHEMKIHRGPVPDPESLKKYEEVCPGSAERILSMAEKNGEHRRASEAAELAATIALNKVSIWSFFLGKILGALITIFCAIGAFLLAWNGKSEVIASILFGAPLVTIISFMVKSYSNKSSKKNNRKKSNI